jgi:hypothetical protein
LVAKEAHYTLVVEEEGVEGVDKGVVDTECALGKVLTGQKVGVQLVEGEEEAALVVVSEEEEEVVPAEAVVEA